MDERPTLQHLIYTINEPKNVNWLRLLKIALVVGVILLVASLVRRYWPKSTEREVLDTSQLQENYEQAFLQREKLDINTQDWKVTYWKDFKFPHPPEYEILYGSSEGNFLTLKVVVNKDTKETIQISALSTNRQDDLNDILNQKDLTSRPGYRHFEVEEKKLIEDIAIIRYSWEAGQIGQRRLRTYEMLFKNANNLQTVSVIGDVNVWNSNPEVVEYIIYNIEVLR